jgi:hypothetical protein
LVLDEEGVLWATVNNTGVSLTAAAVAAISLNANGLCEVGVPSNLDAGVDIVDCSFKMGVPEIS